ncbi:MAG: lysylphosphatidylglycerol synthase transmembrane domain-containing protein [Anaerolineae bacterium]|nr:flippase-like domain-containing protein [Anaerolineae bacterium]MDW8068995.1 lysylphosphatidylglycerol synthase transmembrane domain-containing protein [Anaerolineae bacterium]
MQRRGRMLIGLTISGAALVLALIGMDPEQVAATLTRADYRYLALALVGVVLYPLARAVRWRLLLGPGVSLARCFWVTNIGYLVSNILPFRLGDPARAVLIGRGGAIAIAPALSTVVVERVLDMLTVVAILGGVAPFVAGSEEAVGAGILAGSVALAVMAVLFLMAFHPQRGRQAIRWMLARAPRLDIGRWIRALVAGSTSLLSAVAPRWGQRLAQRPLPPMSRPNPERWARTLEGFLDGLAPLRSGRRGLLLLFWSVVAWAVVVLTYWALLRAFLNPVPPLAAPFLVCVLGLGMAIPSSPGAVGVFHAIARYGLTIPFHVPTDQAITAAFAIHTFQYIVSAVLGLIGLARESLTLGEVTRSADALTGGSR